MSTPQYYKGGRGGAGNFVSKAEVEAAKKAPKPDVELQAWPPAGTSSSSDPSTSSSAADAETSVGAPIARQYQTQGRGGAGNWYEPQKLSSTGTFSATAQSAPGTDKRTTTAPVWRGRGGAGNFATDGGEGGMWETEEEKAERERKVQEVIEREVERRVEEGLRRPEGAHFGNY